MSNRRLKDPKFIKFFAPLNNFANDIIGNLTGTATSITYTANPQGKLVSTYNGSSSKIAFGNVNSSIKSVSFWVKLNTTTQKILELSGTINIDITSGTIGTTGWTSPTVYVDGTITSTISNTLWHFVTVTSTTAVNASAVNLGIIGASYGNISLFNVRFYSIVLTGSEVLALFSLDSIVPKPVVVEEPIDTLPDVMDTTLEFAALNRKSIGTGNDISNKYRNLTKGSTTIFDRVGCIFDGTINGRLSVTSFTPVLSASGSYTLSAWVNVISIVSNGAIIMFDSTRLAIRINSSSKFSLRIVDTAVVITDSADTASITTGRWYYIVGVLNRGFNRALLYVDGAVVSDIAYTNLNIASDLGEIGIGASPSSNASKFNGKIKDPRIYSEAKASGWVSEEFQKGVPDSSLLLSI